MSATFHPDPADDVPWPTSGHRVPVPDTSMLPGREKSEPAMPGPLNNAVQDTQESIDRLAGRVAPAAPQPGERAPAVDETRGRWLQSVRDTVRGNPLASLAAALALGAVIARVTR